MKHQKAKWILIASSFFLVSSVWGRVVCDEVFFRDLIEKKMSKSYANLQIKFLSPGKICGDRDAEIHLERHATYNIWVLITKDKNGSSLKYPVQINYTGNPAVRIENPSDIENKKDNNSIDSKSCVIKKGDRLNMLLDSRSIHSNMQVMALEKGELGQTIRVRSMKTDRRYRVKIINAEISRWVQTE